MGKKIIQLPLLTGSIPPSKLMIVGDPSTGLLSAVSASQVISDLTNFSAFTASINNFTASVTRDSASFNSRINNKADLSIFNTFTSSVTRDSASFDTRINNKVDSSVFNSYSQSTNAYTASDRLNSASFDSRINALNSGTGSYTLLTEFRPFSQSINLFTASVIRDSASFDVRINNKVDSSIFNLYSQSINSYTASDKLDSASFAIRISAGTVNTSSLLFTSSLAGGPNYLSFFSSSVVLTSSMAYQMFSGSGNLSSSLVLENANLWFTGSSNASKTRIQKTDNGTEDILSFINAGRGGNGTARFEFLGSANNIDNRFNLLRMNSAIAAHNWTWVIGSAGTNAVATSTHKVTILGNDPNNTMLLLYNNYTGSSDPSTYLRFGNTSFGGGGAAVGGFINYKSVSNTLNGDLILGNNDGSGNTTERPVLTISRFGKVLVGMTSSLFPNSANSASLQVSGNIAGFHIIGTGVTPTIVSGSGAGVTTSTVSITGSDLSGIINLSSGLTPAANGIIATITYNIPYTGSNTNIALTPANANTALLSGVNMVYIDSSNINFTINSNATGLGGSTSYKWHYIVLQS